MKIMKNFLLTLVLAPYLACSQNGDESITKADPKKAEEKMLAGDYEDALADFMELHAADPQNEKYNYNIGVCYLNCNGNKAKAVPYLEKITHDPKHDPNADYLLGRAYQYAQRFDDAVSMFTKYVTNGKGKEENLKDAGNQIQYCINAKERVKFPLDVKFENLGKPVNSEYEDYYAFVPLDESFIIFNTKRPVAANESKAVNGEYPNVIMISEVSQGQYQQAKRLDLQLPKNSYAEVIGLSANGNTLLLNITEQKKTGNIFISEKDASGKFSKPVMLDKHINSPHEEIAASVSAEGDVIYFTSDRPGGMGGTDIYISRKTPQGQWGLPQNAGSQINTPQNEDFPNISPDGKTLYFSSTGHTSMGGYDIFKVTLNDNGAWENPKNLGYPVNTPMDDYNFRISKNERYGYISAIREEGMGDYDNYRVIFNEVEPELTVMYGQVLAEDGSQINFPDVFISVTNDKNGELIGNYLPNPRTGKYVVILPPGKYTLVVELFNFRLLTQKLEILDKISFQSEREFDLKLQIQK
jgi:hypothetical protein